MKIKNKLLIAISVFILLAILSVTALCLYRDRNAKTINSSEEITSNPIAFYQKDDIWKNDFLGDSEYHMGDSGCLTTCIASQLLMQGISVEEVSGITPGTLNEFFSKNNVYDSEGNLQWDIAGSVLKIKYIRKETSKISESELETLIKNRIYPIVSVKMPKSGNYHFVLLVGSDEKNFLCMDPLNKYNEIVSLSEFGNKIYSVTYCE